MTRYILLYDFRYLKETKLIKIVSVTDWQTDGRTKRCVESRARDVRFVVYLYDDTQGWFEEQMQGKEWLTDARRGYEWPSLPQIWRLVLSFWLAWFRDETNLEIGETEIVDKNGAIKTGMEASRVCGPRGKCLLRRLGSEQRPGTRYRRRRQKGQLVDGGQTKLHHESFR